MDLKSTAICVPLCVCMCVDREMESTFNSDKAEIK